MGNSVDQSLRTVEYTLEWYETFLRDLEAAGYRFRSFEDRLASGDLVLRHDVDLSVAAAVEMARIESSLGIESTYFLLLTSPLYNLFSRETREQVAELEALGHDVGVHFSTHQYWPSNEQPTARELVDAVHREQDAFAVLADDPVDVISFHIPPAWVLDRRFEGIQSAYEPRWFSDIDYVADSSQRWRDQHPLEDGIGETVQLLTHPGLWGETDASFETRLQQAIAESCHTTGTLTRHEFGVDTPPSVSGPASEVNDV